MAEYGPSSTCFPLTMWNISGRAVVVRNGLHGAQLGMRVVHSMHGGLQGHFEHGEPAVVRGKGEVLVQDDVGRAHGGWSVASRIAGASGLLGLGADLGG